MLIYIVWNFFVYNLKKKNNGCKNLINDVMLCMINLD